MTEIETYQPHNALTDVMDYARAVQTANLLPAAYRGKPADIMIAVGLGQAMGLTPAESLYRIDVIQGKPTASAELIAANVRKAGHRLRMKVTEDPPSATCTIIRSDDPDEPFTITRDLAWAERMGLTSKDNYQKQPSTMLSWRAISACARLACPEALYGVAYTPDEMVDLSPQGQPAGGFRAAMTTVEQVPQTSGAEDAPDDVASTDERTDSSAPESPLLNTGSKLAKAMYATIRDAGITKEETPGLYRQVTGREVESSKDLTEVEARSVLDHLAALLSTPAEES